MKNLRGNMHVGEGLSGWLIGLEGRVNGHLSQHHFGFWTSLSLLPGSPELNTIAYGSLLGYFGVVSKMSALLH